MRNQLQKALTEHLRHQTEQYGRDKAQLNELYSLYDDNAQSTLNALHDFADLLYWFSIDDDGEHTDYQHIRANTLISVSVILKNSLDVLGLSLYAKDKIGDCLYSLVQTTQGE